MLVHGLFTSSHVWRDVIARLPSGHRVLVVDLLGHGRSDLPTDALLDVHAHAHRLHRLLDLFGIGDACLVGHGVGAAIALQVQQSAPETVARLLLCNPCLVGRPGQPARAPAPWRRLARTAPVWRALPPAWLASSLHHTLLRGYRRRAAARHTVDIYLRPYRSVAGRQVACRQLQALSRPAPVTLDPDALAIPWQILCGDRDPFRTRGTTAKGLPNAGEPGSFESLPDLAHALPEEAPDRVAAAVRRLLTV